MKHIKATIAILCCLAAASTCVADTLSETPNIIGGGNTLSNPFLGGGDGQNTLYHRHFTRVADNNSPLPRTRVAFSWKSMQNVNTREGGIFQADRTNDLNEYTCRAEWAFLDDTLSLEAIAPWQYTVDPDTIIGTDNLSTKFGDLAFGMKALLHRNETSAFSAGLLVEAPTRDDSGVIPQLLTFGNDAWKLSPYLAALCQPVESVFVQGFASYRMPTSGDGAVGTVLPFGETTFREGNVLMLDCSVGYWLVNDADAPVLTGLAPAIELHYAHTANTLVDRTGAFPFLAQDVIYGASDHLELTAGLTATLWNHATISAGFAFPLRDSHIVSPGGFFADDTDRFFDWSFILQVNVLNL